MCVCAPAQPNPLSIFGMLLTEATTLFSLFLYPAASSPMMNQIILSDGLFILDYRLSISIMLRVIMYSSFISRSIRLLI